MAEAEWNEQRRAKLTPAEQMLYDDKHVSKQTGPIRAGCYICEDPDFAQMGLPLYRACSTCGGHVPADDTVCSDCGLDEIDTYHQQLSEKE